MRTDLEPMCEKNLQVPLDSLTNRAPRNRLPPAERHPSRSQPHVPAPSATRPPPPFRFFPLHPFGRRPAPSEDRTPERTATPSQQRGTQRRRSRRHWTRADKRLFFGHETEFWHSTGETPFRMNPTTWGFPNCRISLIPKTAGNRLRTCQNAVSWPKSNDLAARTAAFRGADGRARSSSIRRGPRPERTTRGLIRKHAPLLQADAPRASSGATTCRSARSPPANTKGSARSISTAETAPLRQNPLPRSAPIANPVRRQPARSNLRRVCDGSTGKACRNRIGFALESRWNRSGAA